MSISIDDSNKVQWNIPILYCECQKQKCPDSIIKKVCIESGCEDNGIFGENCTCSKSHMKAHPDSVFDIQEYLSNTNSMYEHLRESVKRKTDIEEMNLQKKTQENDAFRNHILKQLGIVDEFFEKLKKEIGAVLDARRDEIKVELPEILGNYQKSITNLDQKIKYYSSLPSFAIAEKDKLSKQKVIEALTKVRRQKDMAKLLSKIKDIVSTLVDTEKHQTHTKMANRISEFYHFTNQFKELNKPSLPEPLLKVLQEEHSILSCIDPSGYISRSMKHIHLTHKTEMRHFKRSIQHFIDDFQNIIDKKPDAPITPIESKASSVIDESYDSHSSLVSQTKSFMTSFGQPSLESFETGRSLLDISHTSYKRVGLEVTESDYFNITFENPFLHYFIEGSDNLLYLELPERTKDFALLEWKFTPIQIPELKVFHRHASIATPDGKLFLVGGDQGSLIRDGYCNDMVEVDVKQKKIMPRPPMIHRRRNHGICYLQDAIYIFGGYNKRYLRTCEKYCLKTQRWTEIPNFNSPAMGSMALCTFKNRFIYKFGGEMEGLRYSNAIERYDTVENKWESVHVKPIEGTDFQIGRNPGCVQINPNQIYVFGGNFNLNLHNSNFVLQIDVDEAGKLFERIAHINQVRMPIKDNFQLPNKVLVHKNSIYALSSKKKKMMNFDGAQWLVLNENYVKNISN